MNSIILTALFTQPVAFYSLFESREPFRPAPSDSLVVISIISIIIEIIYKNLSLFSLQAFLKYQAFYIILISITVSIAQH